MTINDLYKVRNLAVDKKQELAALIVRSETLSPARVSLYKHNIEQMSGLIDRLEQEIKESN